VEVKDTGVGIGEEDMEKLFKPFTQIQERAYVNNISGVGLSLYICKKIVKKLHG